MWWMETRAMKKILAVKKNLVFRTECMALKQKYRKNGSMRMNGPLVEALQVEYLNTTGVRAKLKATENLKMKLRLISPAIMNIPNAPRRTIPADTRR